MEDITTVLAFEVKKEMAERYFGFRKRIEEDTEAYNKQLDQSVLDLENKIGFTLLRLYTLLKDEQLILSFTHLIGLRKELFFDKYVLESANIQKRIFTGQKYRGLTRKFAFQNMFYDNYTHLVQCIEEYRKTVTELTEEEETIREQINLFYRNHDIDSIMRFIRELDRPDAQVMSTMQPGGNGGPDQQLSGKLRLHPPLPACEVLPDLPAIPELKTIKRHLRPLLKSALEKQPDLNLWQLTREV